MACLRGTPFAGCGRALQCDEEGCKFRPYAARSDYPADEAASQADCVLQLRLRAGAAADAGIYGARTINWHTANTEPIDLNSEFFQSLEQGGENDRFFLPLDNPADISLGDLVKNPKLQPTVEQFSFPVQPLGNGLVANVDEGNGVYAFDAGPDYNEIFKPMAQGFVEGLRLHSVSLDPVPLDPACTIQWVKPAKDARSNYLKKSQEREDRRVKHEHGHQYRGPRPNAVYLDEYQRWVGSWEDATDEEVLDEITNSVEKGNLTNHREVETKQHGPLDYIIDQTTRDARNHGLGERQLKEFYERNGIDIQVYTKAGEWRSVGVHDLGEGVQSTDELPGSPRVDSSDQGEVQDGPVVSEEWAPLDDRLREDFMYGLVWAQQGYRVSAVDTGVQHGPYEYSAFDAVIRTIRESMLDSLKGIVVDGLFVPEAMLHGYKDFGSRVWGRGRESNIIRGEN